MKERGIAERKKEEERRKEERYSREEERRERRKEERKDRKEEEENKERKREYGAKSAPPPQDASPSRMLGNNMTPTKGGLGKTQLPHGEIQKGRSKNIRRSPTKAAKHRASIFCKLHSPSKESRSLRECKAQR